MVVRLKLGSYETVQGDPVGAGYHVTGADLGFRRAQCSAPAGSQDGSAAAVIDRLTNIWLDRVTRSITGVQRRRDPDTAASTCGASSSGCRSPAVVGGRSDPFCARAVAPPAPSASPVRHTADA